MNGILQETIRGVSEGINSINHLSAVKTNKQKKIWVSRKYDCLNTLLKEDFLSMNVEFRSELFVLQTIFRILMQRK